MRKIFSLALMVLMVAGFSVCQATISPDRMNAGGVYLGQSISEVVSVLGQPVDKFKEEGDSTSDTYLWCSDKSFAVLFSNGIARDIRVLGNNGISTSDGIKVGMPISEVKRILGTPDAESTAQEYFSQSMTYKDHAKQKTLHFIIENDVVKSYSIYGR